MMVKVIDVDAYTYDEPAFALIKTASSRLLGQDRGQFIKRASASLAHQVDSLLPHLHPDQVLVHLLAIGATEDYGANRNGDGFKRACCERYHPTFVKYARFFRSHKNKDPQISYGLVKASEFNPRMKRIELLVALNGSEEAARKFGGFMAKDEMEKLAQGKDIPVSMACKIPFDVCSYCGNRAITQDDYCWDSRLGGMCKAGGLRDNIGALVEIDGGVHQLHADNPDPTFFDISHVFRPADRIAYVSGLVKAASASGVLSGAALARALGVTIPGELMIDSSQPAHVQRMLKTAYLLADLEGTLQPSEAQRLACASAVQQTPLNPPSLFREKFSLALRALADERVHLPPAQFLEAVTGSNREKSAEMAAVVRLELPGVFGRLIADGELPSRVAESHYTPDDRQAPPLFTQWATKLASDYGLEEPSVRRRASRAVLHQASPPVLQQGGEKVAASLPQARRLAEEYALYTLGFLSAIPDSDPNSALTARMAVLQNYIAA